MPALFLKLATTNPYWGDLIKSSILQHEFFQGIRKTIKGKEWIGAAGLITSALATSDQKIKLENIYLSGHLGQDDFESLRALGGQTILFPGWITAWASKAEALGHLTTLERNGEQRTKDTLFVIKDAEVLKFLQCRYFGYRLMATIEMYQTQG